jgi:NADH-quinone oxidoreductase subunit E
VSQPADREGSARSARGAGSGRSAGSARSAPGAARGPRRRGAGSEPPLDPAVARWFGAAKSEFAPARSSTIPMLQSAQAALGYLPADAMRVIARHLGVTPAVIEGVASFYAQFRFQAPGRHRVTVCSGTACYVRGSGKLMDDLQADLHIAPGATSADGAITLESVSCFGACALAPVVVLDDKVLRQQTSASLRKALRELGDAQTEPEPRPRPRPRPRNGSGSGNGRGARK